MPLEYGYISSYKDSVATIVGLDCHFSEVVYCVGNAGLILSLAPDKAFGVFFSEQNIKAGRVVTRTKSLPNIKCSRFLLGYIVNALGLPKASAGNSCLSMYLTSISLLSESVSSLILSQPAPSIISRLSIYEPVPTGIKIVDGLIPVGCGQRELILGDRQTGKSTIGLDTLMNVSSG